MKIVCVYNNFIDCDDELPKFYMKPDSSLLLKNRPLFIEDDKRFVCQVSPVIRIERLGKNIQEKFASLYYSHISAGLIFTPIDILNRQIEKSLPWELATNYDNTSAVGDFFDKENLHDLSLKINDNISTMNTDDWKFSINECISTISRNMTLRTGDLIFVALGERFPIKIDDVVEAGFEDKTKIRCVVK
jgi:2-keto-4-pentenoate hydratase/2-oxohepta-3-ene-1,7-dioic acid hydratase in catechol pathway